MFLPRHLFHIDNLSLIMMGLVSYVAVCVALFSRNYLKGDNKQVAFYCHLVAVVLTVFVMVTSDNVFLFMIAWASSNFLLSRLMLHKKAWRAARQSSLLALKNFASGFMFLGAAFFLLLWSTGETSIQAILTHSITPITLWCSSFLILLSAMTQSSLWPFHRWLTSSLNSPTPVSAMMHAGLVNGGGFLLARFAPLLAQKQTVLSVIFVLGIITAIMGTMWKLMQSDIKRMLACSTMGQMGFMVAQCGLGLFPAAVAHLCWHGTYKAYLFLASGTAAQEKRLDTDSCPSWQHFLLALFFGALGAIVFTLTVNKTLWVSDTRLFLIVLTMIASTQFILPIIRSQTGFKLLQPLMLVTVMNALYGLSIRLIEQALMPVGIFKPQSLNFLHIVVLFILMTAWAMMFFVDRNRQLMTRQWFLSIYVRIFNASQPHPSTVTANRNQYQF